MDTLHSKITIVTAKYIYLSEILITDKLSVLVIKGEVCSAVKEVLLEMINGVWLRTRVASPSLKKSSLIKPS